MTKTSVILLAGLWSLGSIGAYAQSSPGQAAALSRTVPDDTDADIKLFRKDIRSVRKQIMAANLDLTETEAEKFWPVFEQYTAELVKITDKKYALIQEYAQNYTTLTDEQAKDYIKGRGAVEESIVQLRLKYVPVFGKVVPGKITAKLFQIDSRLGLLMDLQLASQTPLIDQ